MGKDSKVSNRVLSWRGQIKSIRDTRVQGETGLGEVPDWVTLALIANESSGDPAEFNPGSSGKATGLLAITIVNAKDGNRTLDQFDGRNPNIQPLDTKGSFSVPNPELVAGQNSLNHFYDIQNKYRAQTNKDPLRMAMLWKSGVGALDSLNGKIGIKTSLLSPEGQKALKETGSRVDQYIADFVRLGQESQEKIGSSAPRSFTPSGKPHTTWFSATSTFNNSNDRIQNYQAETPKCLPPHERRAVTPSPEKRDLARSVRTSSSQFSEINFVNSIDTYLADLAELSRVGFANQYDKKAVTNVQTFLQQAEDSDEEGVSGHLKLSFGNTAENFVKPLETFIVWRKFGQVRPKKETETRDKFIRRHLGLDLQTRDKGQEERDLRTRQFLDSSAAPPRDHFGQKKCYAIAKGTVRTAGPVGKYGLVIYLEHDGGVSSRYAHLSKINVKRGATVTKGQVIGVTGTTEIKDGAINHAGLDTPHLHFEIRMNIKAARGGPSSSVIPNVNNVALDAAAILARAPGPLDPPVPVTRPEEKAVAEAKEKAASLVVNAGTDHGKLVAARAYDQASGQQRSFDMANQSRADIWDEAARVAPVQRNVVEQSAQIDDGALASYEPEPVE